MRRWEIEVANGVGCSHGRAELHGVRKGTSKARHLSKCAGDHVRDFIETAGSSVYEDIEAAERGCREGSIEEVPIARDAAERARQRRSEQKQAALKAEVAKAAERAARLMAKRNKARQTRQRHELRILSEAAQKVAAEEKVRRARQAQEEAVVVQDIRMSREERGLWNAADDSLQKVMEWAMPPPPPRDAVVEEARVRDRDEAVVHELMGEKPKRDDDAVVQKLMGEKPKQQSQLAKEALAANDDETIKRMLDDSANSQEALQSVLGLDRQPLATEIMAEERARLAAARDDHILHGLVSAEEAQTLRDANAIREFMAPYASMQAQAQKDGDAIAHLLEQPLGLLRQQPLEFFGDAPMQELNDVNRIQQMMGPKAFLPIVGSVSHADEAIVANLLNAGDRTWKPGTNAMNLLPTRAINDDDAMRRLLGKAPDRADEFTGAQEVRDVNALHSLIGEPSRASDTRTVQRLMGPFSDARAPALESPLSSRAMPLAQPLLGDRSPYLQDPPLLAGRPESVKNFMGRALQGAGGLPSPASGWIPQAQEDVKLLGGLMGPVSAARPYGAPYIDSDVDMLHHLIR